MKNLFEITFPLALTHNGSFKITFTLEKGNTIAFTKGVYYLHGDNGSGKTTFLNMLALTAGRIGSKDLSDTGTIKFKGAAYNAKGFNHVKAAEIRELSFCIFPQKAFFLPVSTRDNYIILNGTDKQKEATFSSQEYPDLLSGGQQQKVLMDIVLDEKKPVWFLDEPLANLDAERRHYFWMTLEKAYNKELAIAFFIDHGMGDKIKQDQDFRYYNTLQATAETRQKSRPPETDIKQIEIFENNDPQAFFNKQIRQIEKEKTIEK